MEKRIRNNSLDGSGEIISDGVMSTLAINIIRLKRNIALVLCLILIIFLSTTVGSASQEVSGSSNNTKINPVDDIQSFTFSEDMQIAEVLDILADRYEKNIVSSSQVDGSLACKKLFNVSFEDALAAVLGANFKYQQTGNLFKVYTNQEYIDLRSDKNLMSYKVFTLYYITAAEASELVSSILSEEGNIKISASSATGVPVDESISSESDEITTAMNDTLIIHDYPENIAAAEQILAEIDVKPKQVLIEATILSATLTEGLQFGIDWQTLSGTVNSLTDITKGAPDYFGSAGTSAKVGSESLTGGLTVGFAHDNVAGFIRAVEDVTDVTVLANPKILAVNKQLGQVYIGQKIAYQSQTTQTETSTTEEIEFLDTGTKLSFRPYICNDGYIRMDIHPKDSSATLRSSGSSTLPDETSAELVTNIIVKDGETIAIGGLFRDVTTTTKTQIPVLGDLPVIGAVFRGSADSVRSEEVIVLLTPHIITKNSQANEWAQVEDIKRKSLGAKDELQIINHMRRAKDHYENAVKYYIEENNKAAIKELNSALELYPSYLEALRLKDKIEHKNKQKNAKKSLPETNV